MSQQPRVHQQGPPRLLAADSRRGGPPLTWTSYGTHAGVRRKSTLNHIYASGGACGNVSVLLEAITDHFPVLAVISRPAAKKQVGKQIKKVETRAFDKIDYNKLMASASVCVCVLSSIYIYAFITSNGITYVNKR